MIQLRSFCLPILVLAVASGALFGDRSAISSPSLPDRNRVLAFLTQTIDWYRHLPAEQQVAEDATDLLFLDENRPIAGQIVQLSLDFGKAAAALLVAPAGSPSGTGGQTAPGLDLATLIKMEAQSDQQARQAENDLESIRQQLRKARRSERKKLEAALAAVQSRLDLLNARSARLKNLVDFVHESSADSSKTGDLESVVDSLEHSVSTDSTNPTDAAAKVSAQSSLLSARRQTSGILGQVSDMLALGRKLRTIEQANVLTGQLAQSGHDLLTACVAPMDKAFQTGLLADNLQSSDLAALEQQKERLDALTAQINGISPAVMALAKQQILLSVYKSNLMSWRGSVTSQYSSARKSLLLRVGLLAIMVGFLIGLSESFRRLALRHVHDASRRNVIIVVQRILLWSVIGLVLAFAFATDLSSMATFIGLLTAGVAVALQNVILAVVGYFVLVGKLGVRVGDRIQISGVTGEVIDLGLMQFQVREINVNHPGDHPADRVVSFSNSFVFLSPATGLFKWAGETRSVDAASAGR